MGNFVIKKKDGANDKSAGKLDEVLDFIANDVCPFVIVGCSSYILGHLIGQNAGYKRGVRGIFACRRHVEGVEVLSHFKLRGIFRWLT